MSQEFGNSDDILPFLCGAVIADGPLAPGETWRGTMTVDEEICPDPVYTSYAMLGEYSTYRHSKRGAHVSRYIPSV